MGRRVKKAVYAYGSGGWEPDKEILFVYDGWNLIQEKEVSATGDPLFDKFYVWGLDLSQSIQGAGGIGGLVCRVSGGEVRHYFYDANGNVGQLVNPADGSVTARYEYDPFGNVIVADGIDSAGNVFRFSSKYWDVETKLVYYGYRYYAPELGRWLSRDPMNESGGFHLYAFCHNDPINFIDLYGLMEPGIYGPKSFWDNVYDDINTEIYKFKNPEVWGPDQGQENFMFLVDASLTVVTLASPKIAFSATTRATGSATAGALRDALSAQVTQKLEKLGNALSSNLKGKCAYLSIT